MTESAHPSPYEGELDAQLLDLAVRVKGAVVAACDDELRYTRIINPHPTFPPSEVLGKRDDELAPEAWVADLVELKREVLDTGRPIHRRVTVVVEDVPRRYRITAEPIRDEEGAVVGVATAGLDVTVGDGPGALSKELSDRLARLVTPITRHWHAELDAFLRLRPHRVFPGDDLLDGMPRVVGWLAHSLRNGESLDAESVEALRDVAAHWRDAGVAVEECMLHMRILGRILHDALVDAIEDREDEVDPVEVAHAGRRLAEGLSTVKAVMVAAYRDAEDERFEAFGSTIAHEVRDHLGAALSALQLLRLLNDKSDEGVSDERREDLLDRAESSLERANGVVESLRRTGASSGGWRDTPLAEVVARVVEDLRPMAEERGVTLAVADDIPMNGVPGELVELALHNLVQNAVKYADAEKPDSWLRIGWERNGEGRLVVHVGDNGQGIPEHEQRRIFGRFQRGRTTDGDGFGLGLAIARQAVREMGGSLTLESEVGMGSTFSITLPDADAGADPD